MLDKRHENLSSTKEAPQNLSLRYRAWMMAQLNVWFTMFARDIDQRNVQDAPVSIPQFL